MSDASIHPSAIIDSKAEISSDVKVGAYTVIGPNVKIDEGVVIGSHVVIKGPTQIGRNNQIYGFASIGEDPQDKKYNGEQSRLIIGDGNTIREFVTINRGTSAGGGETVIGNENWIMAYVHIAHDCTVGNEVVFSNGATLAGHVQVEDYVVLGGFTLVHQFCRVGTHAFSGMGSALNMDLPPYTMAAGNLAKTYGLNKEGLRRRNFTEEQIAALTSAYKALVVKRLPFEEQIKAIQALVDGHDAVKRLVEFIQSSERGIIR